MIIVFDTNVILSALITQGLSSRVLDICIDKHQLYISSWIINEVMTKLDVKMHVPKFKIDRTASFLNSVFIKVEPIGEIPGICRDADDNNILFLSQFIKADVIITGDEDLLSLETHMNAVIINPRQFIDRYYKAVD